MSNKIVTDPVIFLDIDGVLNHSNHGEDTYYDHFEGKKVPIDNDNLSNFEFVLEKYSDIKIVWSTDWRLYDKPEWNNWANPRLWLESRPLFKDRIIDNTPKKMSSEHFEEIWMWHKAHPQVTHWVAIDDLLLYGKLYDNNHKIETDPELGFTIKNRDDLIAIIEGWKN